MIKANIYDKKLFVENLTVSDSVKFDTVKFTFPESWKGYTKTAVFKTEDGEIINEILDETNSLCLNENECYIPYEVIKSPCFYLSVFGVAGESIATTTWAKVPVLKSGYAEGDEPLEPTPTEYQQIINLVTETKEIAQSVRTDADNGVFKGEKGQDGKDAQTDQNFNPESENAQSGKAVEEVKKEIMDFSGNAFASAIKNTVSGSVISINDVSSQEYSLKISVRGKNLIPYPYTDTTKTINGITFIDNGDGTITANGTATDIADFILCDAFLVKKGMCLSGCPSDGDSNSSTYEIQAYLSSQNHFTTSTNYNNHIAVEDFPMVTILHLRIRKGYTVDNLVFKPQIEMSRIATEYVPYIDIKNDNITVSMYGKNLFNSSNSKYNGGAVIMENKNGKITVSQSGAATWNSANIPLPNILEGQTVTVSAKISTSGANCAALRIMWIAPDGNVIGSDILSEYNVSGDKQYIAVSGIVPAKPTEEHNQLCLMLYSNTNAVLNSSGKYTATYSEIQIEIGNTTTEYEQYIEPQNVVVDKDGRVEGLTSVSPNMTLITNTDGVIIDCTYNADTKMYIDNKLMELSTKL